MVLKRIIRTITSIIVALLVGTLVSATLVRMAPGFDSDERLLDSRLSAESLQAIRAEQATRYLDRARAALDLPATVIPLLANPTWERAAVEAVAAAIAAGAPR